jgi:hypothetical protein
MTQPNKPNPFNTPTRQTVPNNQTPPKPPAPGNLASRFGSTPAKPATPPPAKPSQPTPGLPRSPFTPSTLLRWDFVPIATTLVRFDLRGLGDPFHRLLGHPLNIEFGDVKNLSKALEKGGENVDQLREHLESAWLTYGLSGAVLIYNWGDGAKNAIAARAAADKPVKLTNNTATNNKDNDDEDDSDDVDATSLDDQTKDAAQCLRAIDVTLVLNVLSRTRTNLLLGDAQSSFDRRLIERSLITDDPRLVALARATGCIEEGIGK